VRLGIPTASQFHKVLTPTGKISSQCTAYSYRLIAERLLKESMDDQLGHVEWVQRGKQEQPNAERQLEFANGIKLDPVGFITSDDGRIGCSPDALIRGKPEAVEIKCPAPWTQVGYLLDGPGNDYRPQVQGQLLVGEFDRVHFYSWHPRMPAFHLATQPDGPYIRELRSALDAFCDLLDKQTERARALGAYVTTEWPTLPLEQAYPETLPDPLKIIIP
jgi:hypothetical protein